MDFFLDKMYQYKMIVLFGVIFLLITIVVIIAKTTPEESVPSVFDVSNQIKFSVLEFEEDVTDWKTTTSITYEYVYPDTSARAYVPIFETVYWCEYQGKPNRYERCNPATE